MANPISYVSTNDPPFYIMHGTNDTLVPHSGSVILYKVLKKGGVKAIFVSLPGYKRGDSRFNTGERIEGVQEFLDKLFIQEFWFVQIHESQQID